MDVEKREDRLKNLLQRYFPEGLSDEAVRDYAYCIDREVRRIADRSRRERLYLSTQFLSPFRQLVLAMLAICLLGLGVVQHLSGDESLLSKHINGYHSYRKIQDRIVPSGQYRVVRGGIQQSFRGDHLIRMIIDESNFKRVVNIDKNSGKALLRPSKQDRIVRIEFEKGVGPRNRKSRCLIYWDRSGKEEKK